MIRFAEMDDIDSLVGMGERFYSQHIKGKGLRINLVDFGIYCEKLIESDVASIFVDDTLSGSISGTISPWYMDHSQYIIMENWWWVDPISRGKRIAIELEKALVEWGKAKGASMLLMASVGTKSVERYYIRKNYTPLEQYYIKGI